MATQSLSLQELFKKPKATNNPSQGKDFKQNAGMTAWKAKSQQTRKSFLIRTFKAK